MATMSFLGTAKQLYVAKAVQTSALSADGDIKVVAPKNQDYMYFSYKKDGEIFRSDIIPLKSIRACKKTLAAKMQRKLNKATVKLNTAVSSTPIAGQYYEVILEMSQFGSLSDEHKYSKIAGCTAISTSDDVLKTIAEDLQKSLKKESIEYLKVTYASSTITIEEVEQPWVLGVKSSDPVVFRVITNQITVNSVDTDWATVDATPSTTVVKNGKLIADMEYFYIGERGDQYRGTGFPKVYYPTTYMVDPSKEYDVLDITYYHEGVGNDPHKSEKCITIVAENSVMSSLDTAVQAVLNPTTTSDSTGH